MNPVLSRLAGALALTLVAHTAAAQGTAQQIEVRGALPVRTDVRALCPDIDVELNDALVRAVQEVATAAVIDVRFDLTGSRVGEVSVGDGPARYQRALRRAVRGLQCDAAGEARPQTLAMRVRFVDPFARNLAQGAERTLALVEPAGAAR
jgi:hypothetical protein